MPADRERCTWAASTIRNGSGYSADITFVTSADFQKTREELYKAAGLQYGLNPFPLDKETLERRAREPEIQDIKDLGEFRKDIEPMLDKEVMHIDARDLSDLRHKIFPYVSRVNDDGKRVGKAYAVKQVDITVPLTEGAEFTIDDLPGTNAPGNRAEKMTFEAIRNNADGKSVLEKLRRKCQP